MKSVYETFEFSFIKERLKKHAFTELAKEYVEHLEMFTSKDDLLMSLNELKEAISYSYKYGRINIFNHINLIPSLKLIKKGGLGSKEFFYQVGFLLDNIKTIKQEFKEKDNYPLINELVEQLSSLDNVKQKIDRVISPSLDILDSASSNLYRIRSKISHLENGISSLSSSLVDKYRNYLADGHGALRNGQFTLMVKATYKNRIQGITLDVSDTGQTYFIEPQELIEVYNNIASLKEEENREIQAILKDLSNYVSSYNFELLTNNYVISKLDFIFTKATFAITYEGNIASISDKKIIKIENAAHPLIDKDKVVRNSFIMDKEKLMIITGPNAGGKTVALKVVGLLVVMHQCGLALPIKEGGEICFFNHIYADIGDNQSLIDNLSTFSSHIVKIKEILNEVDSNSLVIIDELGSGTSPLDGEALGLGVIDYLLNKNCFALISSHYEALKSYALENDNILCASMIFDEKNMAPTYRLRLHVASSSYGIEVASRLGIQDEVIIRAKKYIEEKKSSSKEIKLELLNKRLEETEKLKLDLIEKENKINKIKEELLLQEEKNKKIRNQIIEQADEEKQKIINEAKEEIDQIFLEFKNTENKKLHEVIAAKHKIDEKANNIEEEDYENAIVNVNDQVEMISSHARGKVIRISGDKVTLLLDSGLQVQTKLNAIRKCEVIKKKKLAYTPDFISTLKSVPTEVNVIGLTVKEALEIIKKYLDDCMMVHYKQVRIIHGSGTGRLRSGVQEYLKTSPYVDSYRLGGAGEGGVGATVVTLK